MQTPSTRTERPQRNPQLFNRRIHILEVQRRNGPLGVLLRRHHRLIITSVISRGELWLRSLWLRGLWLGGLWLRSLRMQRLCVLLEWRLWRREVVLRLGSLDM